MVVDEKDLRIVSELRRDSGASLKEISKNTNIPVSTIFDRIKNLDKDVITRKVALIDFTKLGYNIRTVSMLRLEKRNQDEIRRYLENCSSINCIHSIEGKYDLLVGNVFKNIKEMAGFVKVLKEKFDMKDLDMHYITETIQSESFLSK